MPGPARSIRTAAPGAVRELHAGPPEWLRGVGAEADVVLSSRVRLARNLAGFPFVNLADRASRLAVLDAVRERVMKVGLRDQPEPPEGRGVAAAAAGAEAESAAPVAPGTLWADLHEAARIERQMLAERHAVSRQHAQGKCGPKDERGDDGVHEPRAVAIDLPTERLGLMVNEEDHIRLQAIRSGLALDEALAEADALDDRLDGGLDYAFSPRFGYLTACPTNVGTGVRFSVMLHLPGLRITGDIEKVKRAAHDMGLAVRGSFGEGSEALGDLYQLSNQTTLGRTERTLMRELAGEILPGVIQYERTARSMLMEKRRVFLEDHCWRAVGLLTSARLLTSEEAMQQLSLVRLGATLGLLPQTAGAEALHTLLLAQPAHLQLAVGEAMTQDLRRSARAALCRKRLADAMNAGSAGSAGEG